MIPNEQLTESSGSKWKTPGRILLLTILYFEMFI